MSGQAAGHSKAKLPPKRWASWGGVSLWIGLLASLLLAACTENPTAFPSPTVYLPTRTMDPHLFPALETPTQKLPTPNLTPSPELATTPYTHPSQAFTLFPPTGWAMEQGDYSATFTAPDGRAKISIQVVNTGSELDGAGFENLIKAREENLFKDYPDYAETSRNVYGDSGSAAVIKDFSVESIPKTVQTRYYQIHQAVYMLDYWSDQDISISYSQLFNDLTNQLTFNDQAISGSEAYLNGEDLAYETAFYILQMPSTWTHTQSSGDVSQVDTFSAPDQHALVQSVIYDDGEPVSTIAGSFALILMNSYYSKDLEITSDTVLADGRERLVWYSKSAGYRGTSYFETKDTTFSLFTLMYDGEYEAIYQVVLDRIDGSYQDR